MSGRRKQHWIRCWRCSWGDTRVWVPLACPGCGRGGSWSDAPRGVPRKEVNWDKIITVRQFVPLTGAMAMALPDLTDNTEIHGALQLCMGRLAERWLKEFGVEYGKRVGGRDVGELRDFWRADRPGLLGAWVMVQAWYKPAAGGE